MEEQSGMYVLCTRNAQERLACPARMIVCVCVLACYGCSGCFSVQEPMARIIGAYCEHLSAPGHHAAILDRHLVGIPVHAFPHLPCCAHFVWNEGSKQTAPRSSAYASEKAILWMMPELWMIRLKTFNRIWEPLGETRRTCGM